MDRLRCKKHTINCIICKYPPCVCPHNNDDIICPYVEFAKMQTELERDRKLEHANSSVNNNNDSPSAHIPVHIHEDIGEDDAPLNLCVREQVSRKRPNDNPISTDSVKRRKIIAPACKPTTSREDGSILTHRAQKISSPLCRPTTSREDGSILTSTARMLVKNNQIGAGLPSPSTFQSSTLEEQKKRKKSDEQKASGKLDLERFKKMRKCKICGGSYSRAGSHRMSNIHRSAVLLRKRIRRETVRHPKFGIRYKLSKGQRYSLIIFPGYKDYFELEKRYNQLTSGDVNLQDSPSTSTIEDNITDKTLQESLQEISDFLDFYRGGIRTRVKEFLKIHHTLKIIFILNVSMMRVLPDKIERTPFALRVPAQELFLSTDFDKWFNMIITSLRIMFEESQIVGSGWTFEKCIDLEFHVNRYAPLSASSYVELPECIINKHAVINVKNFDARCFFYSIGAHYLDKNTPHKERVTKYTLKFFRETGLNFKGIKRAGPTSFSEIDTFERNNKCSVNVYGLTESKKKPRVYPLRISKEFHKKLHFDLLYITDGDRKHYCYITDLSRLVSSQVASYNTQKLHICRACLRHFLRVEHLEKHMLVCCKFQPVRPQMPIRNVNDFICYNTSMLRMGQYVPYTIYSDFETSLSPIAPPDVSSSTVETHLHKPTSFAYYIVCRNPLDETEYKPVLYRGPDAVKVFWRKMRKEAFHISNMITRTSQRLIIDHEEAAQLRNTPNPICHLCKRPISNPNDLVLDHDHLSKNLRGPGEKPSNVRGIAHSICNVQFSIPRFIPAFFHNASKYDFKLILSECVSVDEKFLRKNRKMMSRRGSVKKNKPKRRRNMFIDDQAEDEDGSVGEESEEGETSESESLNGFINDETESEEMGDSADDESIIGRGQQRERGVREFDSDVGTDNESANDGDDDDDDSYERESTNIQMVNGEEGVEKAQSTRINVLARSAEDFISFEKVLRSDLKIRFLDSYRFLSASLSYLASVLEKEKMKNVRKFFPSNEEFDIASRKGVFPYEYISDPSKFLEPGLPAKEDFFSSLTGEHISEEDYKFAQLAFQTLKCQSLGEYSDQYLTIDVLLLADIFETFRETCFNVYHIDPCHTYSAPSLSRVAMLKTIKKPIPLITDFNIHLFMESSIRGGFCNVSKRYVCANNRHMGESFDKKLAEEEGESYLIHLDANNLYGWSLGESLPYGEFEWVPWRLLCDLKERITHIPDNGPVGYIIECDLHIPKELHDYFQDFPMAPEKISLSTNKSVPPKLIATLHDKKNYVIHYRYLKTLLKYGIKLERIHSAVRFSQEPWMREYVLLNNRLRAQARNKFESDFFKLMVNSVYGKMLEGSRGKRDFKLVHKPHLVQRWVNKPNFKSSVLLNEDTNLFLIEMKKISVKLNKPIQVGMAVLDISKAHMAEFHYGVMKKLFPKPDQLFMFYTDTDSLLYRILISLTRNNKDLYDILYENKEHFDFSEYPEDHKCYDTSNKKVLGKFKDEGKGETFWKFIGLLSKLYTIKYFNKMSIKKAKGVNRSNIKNNVSYENYLAALFENKPLFISQSNFRSKNLQISTVVQQKLALSANDDKRYTIPGQHINTLPWGHYKVPESEDLVLLTRKHPQKFLVPAPPSPPLPITPIETNADTENV